MKMNTLISHLVVLFGLTTSEFSELLRALKEGSSHFRELISEAEHPLGADILVSQPGPGGGLDADPFRTTFFLLAFLLGTKRADAAKATWEAWHIHPSGTALGGWTKDGPEPEPVRCSITGKTLFGDAFKAILADADLAARIKEIRIDTSGAWAEITSDKGNISRFDEPSEDGSSFGRVAWISGHALFSIALLLNR